MGHHPLPDDAIVVRGGYLKPDRLEVRAERDKRDDGTYVLSTFAGVKAQGEQDEDVLRRLVEVAEIPHGHLSVTTAGELRRRGFTLEQTGEPDCHYDVVLGTVNTPEVIQRFIDSFLPPRRNAWRG